MNTELQPPVVTEDDVLKGLKEVEVLARDGTVKKIIIKAMSWRTALASPFRSVDEAMVRILENCITKADEQILDTITPLHLVWLTNVAQQLTNGIDALKKAMAAKVTAPPPPGATSTPSSAS